MGDYEPLYAIRKFSASELADLREETIERYDLRSDYLAAFEEAEATQQFLNAHQNYAVLQGHEDEPLQVLPPAGVVRGPRRRRLGVPPPRRALRRPERRPAPRSGIPTSPRSFPVLERATSSSRTCTINTIFSVNVYANERREQVRFAHIANLFWPPTVDACFESDGSGPVPGIKDDENNWNLNGHADRIVRVDEECSASSPRSTTTKARPPCELVCPPCTPSRSSACFDKFAEHPRRLGDLQGEYFATQHWNETNAQKDGTIKYDNHFPENAWEWVVSGPHFFVGTPLYKTPRNP